MERTTIPVQKGSVVLGPTENPSSDLWQLDLKSEDGEHYRLVLRPDVLAEIDAEFTGLEHHR